jgi:hypothetical protein
MPGPLLITQKLERPMPEPLSKHPGVILLKIDPTTSKNAINLLTPFLRLPSSAQFKNRLVILSSKRAKRVLTA